MATKITPLPNPRRRDVAAREACAVVRRWRCRAGLIQVEAAEVLGCSPRQFREWESGRTCPPGWVVIACLEDRRAA